MVDNLKPEDRTKTMRAVKGKGTRPERSLFSMLAGMRLKGWQKNVNDIVGRPDVVFPVEQVAIFLDGCFWHGCFQCQRKLPETNREYWKRKISRNIELARENNQKLAEDGWLVLRIWEHEIKTLAARKKVRDEIRHTINKRTENQ